MKTYPEMNEIIKDLLRRSDEPMNLYIVARLEELETQLAVDAKRLKAMANAIERMDDMQDQTGFDLPTVQECLRVTKTALKEVREC